MSCLGIDFGTTNSSVALAHEGDVGLAHYSLLGEQTASFRSILYMSIDERVGGTPGLYAGPKAIEQYLEEGATGRLVQSIKSFLPSSTFEQTTVLRTVYRLEDLVGAILVRLRASATQHLGPLPNRVVAGRPVRFANAHDQAGEDRALDRLRLAYGQAGFDEVAFLAEPVAAAYAYARRSQDAQTVLVADFGGGTSDYCVLRTDPKAPARSQILATAGVGVAGDTFDARIVQSLVGPRLGRHSRYRTQMQEWANVPDWIYVKLSQWSELSFLRSDKALGMLHEMSRYAENPQELADLINIVEENLGFYLYKSVADAKAELSSALSASVAFDEDDISFDLPFERADFDGWIASDIADIEAGLNEALAAAGLQPADIDRVFMTGGTAFVPKVRSLFAGHFGDAKLAGGDELTAVATGLALAGTAMPDSAFR